MAYDGIAYYSFVAIDWLAAVSDLGPAWIEAAKRAVELDDRLAEAHTELANAYFWYEWDWTAAQREFQRAIQLDQRYAPAHEYYGWYLVLMGRVNEGIAEFRRALEIDPLSAESNALFGWNLWVTRRYDDAMERLRTALDLDPTNWWAHANMGRCFLSQGMPSKAIAEF